MAVNWGKVWKAAETIFGVASLSRRALGDPNAAEPERGIIPAGGGLIGEVEARLTGVVVSALKEAFDRDAQRLEAERAALEDQRRRAEEALRLELIRQAGDRVITRLRSIGALALVAWIMSVLFAMRFPEGLAGAGRIVLGLGWACLLGSGLQLCGAYARDQMAGRCGRHARHGSRRARRRSSRARPVADAGWGCAGGNESVDGAVRAAGSVGWRPQPMMPEVCSL